MELTLVRYKGFEDQEYCYFWTEKQHDVNVHMSPMFSSKDEAVLWLEEMMNEARKACIKMKDLS